MPNIKLEQAIIDAVNVKSDTEEILIICAWCKKYLGKKEVIINTTFKGAPTHGICEKCKDKFEKDYKGLGK
jgi:uncharacterized CHY-type Zn-finger protein